MNAQERIAKVNKRIREHGARSAGQQRRLDREFHEGYAAYLAGQYSAQEISGAAPVMGEHFTTVEAAKALGVHRTRIWQLVKSGELPAVKVGRDWLISAATLADFKRKPPGRPKGQNEKPLPNGEAEATEPQAPPDEGSAPDSSV